MDKCKTTSIDDVKGEVVDEWHYIIGDAEIHIMLEPTPTKRGVFLDDGFESIFIPEADIPALELYLFKAKRRLKALQG